MIMDIKIQIGNENEKALIKQEMEFFVELINKFEQSSKILQIIIPENFSEKVNELENRSDFTGSHGITESAVVVLAKNIVASNNRIIVLNPMLFFGEFDSMIRSFIIFHEVAHIINSDRFPTIATDSFYQSSYLGNLNFLFDEYFADRLAYKITDGIFKEPTECWKKFSNNSIEEYWALSSNGQYYQQIKTEIDNFRLHGDVELFMKLTHDSISVVTVATVHGFARYHHIEKSLQNFIIPPSHFINDRTIELMKYFKDKYEQSEIDLSDGVDIMCDYMRNFGVEFEDHPEGGYLYVLDI